MLPEETQNLLDKNIKDVKFLFILICQMLVCQIILYLNYLVMEATDNLGKSLAGYRIGEIISCIIIVSYTSMNFGFARMV